VASFAAFFFGAFEAAEFEAGAAEGVFAEDALGDEVVDVGVEVEAEFGVDLRFEDGAVEGGAELGADAAEDGHGASTGWVID
jgi:hypothetical protein